MIEKFPLVFMVLCLSCFVLAEALAESSDPVHKSDDNDVSFVRGWIVGDGVEAVSLFAQGPNDENPRQLCSVAAGENVMNPSYTEFVTGNFQFQLKSGGKVLHAFKAELAEKAAYTLLAWRRNGQWELKLYADGPFVPNSLEHPLRLLNFAASRETLITLDRVGEKTVAANTVEEFMVLPKLTSFTVKVLAADGGPPAQSSGDVDFAEIPSAYIVIAPDYRGRMRPRVISGGYISSLDD
jgi:hypothetical protein